MSATPFMGAIMTFAGNMGQHAVSGWAICDGQSLPIRQYQALYSILGTTFGGDGVTQFSVPNTTGRLVIGSGYGQSVNAGLGETLGARSGTLTPANMPPHVHSVTIASGTPVFKASTAAPSTDSTPTNAVTIATGQVEGSRGSAPINLYAPGPATGAILTEIFGVGALRAEGGGNPFPLVQPNLPLHYEIALQGRYPAFTD